MKFERSATISDFTNIFISNILVISKSLVECHFLGTAFSFGYTAPLYLYPENNGQQSIEQTAARTPNLNPTIVQQIADNLSLTFTPEKTSPTPPKEGLLEEASLSGRLGKITNEMKNPNSPPSVGLGEAGYITANPLTYKLIKEMRDALKDNPTEAEKVIWEYLRNKKTGYKIRRQHIIDDFIMDFVCLRKK
nr:DUF559 domain-containing protein [Adhaeribacter arboris]